MKHPLSFLSVAAAIALCGTAAAQYNIPTITESTKLTTKDLWSVDTLLGESATQTGPAAAEAAPIPGSPNVPRVIVKPKIIVNAPAKATSESSACNGGNSNACNGGSCDNNSGNNPPQVTPAKTVAEAIADINFINGTPATDANYYIYLHSASWCPPCRALMPKVVKEYKKLKKANIELILIGHDQTRTACQAYLKKYKATFACTPTDDNAYLKLPGNGDSRGVPHAFIVDKDGKLIKEGHGQIILEWKKHCR